MMEIISRKPFRDATRRFPSAGTAIEDCYRVLKNGTFNTPDELRQVFPSLVDVKNRDRWWAIDIGGSQLRLVAFIEFKHNRLSVRHIVPSVRLPRDSEGNTTLPADIMDDTVDDIDLEQIVDALPEPVDLLESTDDAPVIRLINAMLTEAIRKQASDIHIEPFEKRLAIRYRVDGVMQKLLQPPRAIAPLVISRLKVMAKLDIAEKRLPQDGRISLRVAGRPIDVRVSTLPSGHGERVVLRLLDKQAGRLELEQLGLSKATFNDLTRALTQSHGLILVTGPTGSGKTTSLYAAVSRLNTADHSILTVEDPIECSIDGIGQTQVNTKVNLNFAQGLRAILRQNPDIVMVGEIRDVETAEVAIQASLTGHLVLSTLNSNTAIGAVTHLRDMGIEPFLLSSSIVGLVGQRLVRLLCEECKKPYQPTDHELNTLGISRDKAANILQPHGCSSCNHSGYAGSSGIYEVVTVDDKLRSMIRVGGSEQEMEQHARKSSSGIIDDSVRLVVEGKTSIEEMLQVAQEVTCLSEPLVLTKAAALKVKTLIEEEGNTDTMLRVFVTGDGSSDFKYGFTFDEAIQEGDIEVEKQGVKILIDAISFQHLAGAEIDYTEGPEGSQFVVRSPNESTPSNTN